MTSITTSEQNSAVRILLNSTYASLKNVIPIQHEVKKPKLAGKKFTLQYGVLIGIIGDIQGKLVHAGKPQTFAAIGETMFGMPLSGEMLTSFSGELGNMIAGNLSSIIGESGININITTPTIMKGQMVISGHKQAIEMSFMFENAGEVTMYLLLD